MATETTTNGESMKELVKVLKDLIIELKGTVDELRNPIMQPEAIANPISKPTQTTGEPKRTGISEEQPILEETKTEQLRAKNEALNSSVDLGKNKESYVRGVKTSFSSEKMSSFVEPSLPPLALVHSAKGKQMDLSELAGLMRLVYDLMTKVPSEYLVRLTDTLEQIGLIEERQKKAVQNIIELAKIGYEHGLGIDDSIAIMAALAKELGLDVTEITEELVKAILVRRGERDWGSQQQ